jgi:2-polyprenyl-6-methoxyphenol hydroxylase-like FAD-dependent oxidoreductase
MEGNGDHAVVAGASVAGLLAARVLSDAYARVTVVERDARSPIGEHRKGVPQGRHVHGLLPRGVEIVDDLFPAFTDELTQAGAHFCELFQGALFCPAGRPLARIRTGLRSLHASRPFLEGHLRERVQALANVEFVDRCDVVGLVADEDRDRVTGIRLLRRADGSAEEVLAADLVIDATGRASRTPAWLDALGYPRPEEEQVQIRLGYASCPLRLHPGALNGDQLVLFGAEPGRPSGLALSAIEGDGWMLSLFGYGEHRPPGGVEGFWSFAAQVAPPDLLRVIRDAEPLDRIVLHRLDSNLRRRYERLHRFPDGLVVVGDALCSFNPIYAQGMTVAALEAVALRRCLEGGGDHLARRFFRAAAKTLDHAWRMATGADLALPVVEGRRPLPVRIVNAYMRRLLAVATHDPAVATIFMRVTGMVDPLATLFRPTVAFRVLRPARGRTGAAASPGP